MRRSDPCRFESGHRHHVGAKSALLRRLFMPAAKKTSSARSLAPPFQTATAGVGLRFGFLNAHGYLSVNASHVGEKSALLRRLFMPAAKKDVIRPLPCSSFPNRNLWRWVAVWVPKCARLSFCQRFPRRSKVRFAPTSFYAWRKRCRPPAHLPLLSKSVRAGARRLAAPGHWKLPECGEPA